MSRLIIFFLESFCFLASLPSVIRCCCWQRWRKRTCICDFAWDRWCEERSCGVAAGWQACCYVDLLLLLRTTTLWTRADEDLLRCLPLLRWTTNQWWLWWILWVAGGWVVIDSDLLRWRRCGGCCGGQSVQEDEQFLMMNNVKCWLRGCLLVETINSVFFIRTVIFFF